MQAMNEEKILRKLAAAARTDAPGALDVRAGVLTQIEAAARPSRPLGLWAFAASAAAAAVILFVVADHIAAMRQDPVGEVFETMMRASI